MSNAAHIKNVYKHTAFYSIAVILQKAVGFLMLPVYANYLGAHGYGIAGLLDIVVSVMTVCVGWGISGGMQRFYFEKESEEEKKVLVSTGILVMFLLVMAVSLLPLLCSGPIALFLLGKVEMGSYYVVIAILTFIFDMTATSAGCFILIKQQSRLYSSLSFSRFMFGLVLNIYFIVVLKLGVLGFLYSNLMTSVLYSIIVHVYAFKQVGFSYNKNDAGKILRFSLPLLPGSLAMFVRNDIDKVFIRKFLGISHIGTYSMLLNFSAIIPLLILQPFLNIWSVKQLEICETTEGPHIMARVFTLQLTFMLFVGLILAVEIPLLLKIMTPREFWVPGIFALLAVISKILFAAYYNLNFGLVYAKLTKIISLINFTTALLSVILNYLAIQHFGLIGALVSSCLVFTLQCTIAYFMADRHYHIPFEWMKIGCLILITAVLFFGIDLFNLSSLGMSVDGTTCKAVAANIIDAVHLSFLLKSKIVGHIIGNMNLMMDALAKLGLCCLFIIATLLLGVIKKENISEPFYVLFNRFGMRSTK